MTPLVVLKQVKVIGTETMGNTLKTLVVVMALFLALGLWFKTRLQAQQNLPSASFPRNVSQNHDGFDSLHVIESTKVVVLNAEVDGVIEQIDCHPQEFVKKGDLLVKMDSDLIELEVQKLQFQVDLNTSKQKAEINLQFARAGLAIVKRLFETVIGGTPVSSPKEYQEAQQREQLARLGDTDSKLERELLRLDLKRAAALLEKHTIRAPMDSVIIPFKQVKHLERQALKKVEVGETISARQYVIAMMKVDRLKVTHWVPQAQINTIRLSQEVQVLVEGEEETSIRGKIIYISPAMQLLGTVEVTTEFDNPPVDWKDLPPGSYRYRIRPGMKARVRL